ncbi:MAG: agmatine deiminase family protein [Hyphomonadaceae bacterium]|nr:agmatine deiminase family protein [Hyphomonadaceae bacterium]
MQSFQVPAEDAAHARTWMCWPSTPAIYGGQGAYYESVQASIGRLAAAIAEHEPVTVLADASVHPLAARLCGPRVELLDAATDDMWARDSGPVFVRSATGAKAAVDFNFNAWGGKQRHASDSLVARAIAASAGCDRVETHLVGEGGGLEYDGDGTLILTESCWVNDNRNPGLSRSEIEVELKRLLGVETVIWTPGVRGLDITDGHIDGSVRIVRPGVLMMAFNPEDTTENADAQAEAKTILSRTRDARGRAFEIVEIEDAMETRSRGADFFSAYTNYYVGNGALYTPEFGDARADRLARAAFERLYPDRRIVALNLDRIYENGGGVHCVTQQEPA